jgi:hypothetical protein
MRHSDIRLTMKTYTDPRLLDVAGAVDALPDLSLESITATASLRRTGTDEAFLVAPSVAPMVAPNTVQTGQKGAFWDNIKTAATSDRETKKPLESQGNQGFSPIGPAGFEPTTSTTPTKRTTPSGPTKTKGKRNTQGNGCTNGCTCDRCLLELADALKGQLSIDERRKLAVLLLQ